MEHRRVFSIHLAARAFWAMAALAGGMAGCHYGNPPPPSPGVLTPPLQDGQPMALAKSDTKLKDGRYVVWVRLQVASVEVPVGTASNSEELWSYLNEESASAIHPVSLSANGLRIGIGRGDTWPDVAKILERMTGRKLAQNATLVVPGDPVPMTIKAQAGPQTLFAFYADGTFSGQDYPPGDNLLTLACTIDMDEPTRLFVSGQPQVRSAAQKLEIESEGADLMMKSRPTVFSLSALAFTFNMASGDFFVIGPSSQARATSSVGYNFLCRKKQGLEFETVLIVTPEVFYAPLQPAPATPKFNQPRPNGR